MREGHRVHPARSSGRIIDWLLACTSHTVHWAPVRCAWRQQLGGNHLGAIKSMQTLWNLITMTNWTNVSSCPFSITLCAEDIMDINATAEDFEYPVNLFPVPILTGITVTCSFLFLVGIAGNLLTILVVTKYKDMRTTTNLYLCSMALSDLLIFLCMPLDLYRVWRYRPWNFGDELCNSFSLWAKLHVLHHPQHHRAQRGEILRHLFSLQGKSHRHAGSGKRGDLTPLDRGSVQRRTHIHSGWGRARERHQRLGDQWVQSHRLCHPLRTAYYDGLGLQRVLLPPGPLFDRVIQPHRQKTVEKKGESRRTHF